VRRIRKRKILPLMNTDRADRKGTGILLISVYQRYDLRFPMTAIT
jgi:hypothetical protein